MRNGDIEKTGQRYSDSLESWERFLSSAAETARKMLDARPVKNGQDEALVVRNCARLMRQALDWEVECNDSQLSRLSAWEVLSISGGPPGPNLDTPYAIARLDSKSTYVLSGRTDGLLDINVCVRPDFPPKSYDVYGDLGFSDIKPKDGKWELVMGPSPIDDRPFLKFPEQKSAGVFHLFLRIFWADWSHQTRPEVNLECIDSEIVQHKKLTSQALCNQLDKAATFLDFRAKFQHDWFEWFFDSVEAPAKIPGGNSHVNYKAERYAINAGEVLLIEFDEPDARYWSVQLYDGLVYDCMDFFRNITLRNNLQSYVAPDKRVQIVVSNDDPGIMNWLDSGGVEKASWFYRSIWSENNPTVTARIVKAAELKSEIHPATPQYGPIQRKEEAAMRRRKLAHHFYW